MNRLMAVYGTLRRDIPDPAFGDIGGQVLGYGHVRARMHSRTAYPACVPDPDSKAKVQVISFADADEDRWQRVLNILDSYEGCPYLFRRTQDTVALDDGTEVEAWIYYYATPGNLESTPRVPNGDWKEMIA